MVLTVGRLQFEALDLLEVFGAQDPLAVHAEVRRDLPVQTSERSEKKQQVKTKHKTQKETHLFRYFIED